MIDLIDTEATDERSTRMTDEELWEIRDNLVDMPEDEMTDDQRWLTDMFNIEYTLVDMHACIEGGEAREDYDTSPASWHFMEVDDFLSRRIERVRDGIRWHFQMKALFASLEEEE